MEVEKKRSEVITENEGAASSLLHRSWIILIQAVLGASCSEF